MDDKPITILLVEDNPGDARLLQEMLAAVAFSDYQITVVGRLASALQELEESDFDLIVLDLGLPDSQGFDTFARVQEQAAQLPIIVLTGFEDETFGLKTVREGAQDYLIKGQFDGNLLARAMRYAIERKRTESQRQAALEELRRSEERWRTYIDGANDLIYALDTAGKMVSVNRALCEASGYREEELLGRSILELLAPESYAEAADALAKVLSQESVAQIELEAITKSGCRRTLEVRGRMLYEEGQFTGTFHIARDVTERRQAESQREAALEALRESDRRFRGLIEHSPDGIMLTNEQGVIIEWNRGAEQITGLERAKALGRPVWDIQFEMTPDERQTPRAREQIQKLHQLWLDSGEAPGLQQLQEVDIQCLGGARKAVQTIGFAIETDLGYRAGNILRDVTELKQAEAELRQTELRLQTLVSNAPVVLWALDNQGIFTLSEGKALKEIGLKSGEVVGMSVFGLYHEYPDILADIRRALAGEELTVHHEVGGVVFDSRLAPTVDQRGEVVGLMAVSVDVTETARAEQLRKEAYDIIRMSPAVAFLWRNAEGWPVEYVTDNVQTILGYTADDLISGRVLYGQVVHPDDLERVTREVADYGHEQGREEFLHEPYRVVTKDGRVRWLDDRTHIRRDETGQTTHYQGVVLDITERREAEAALRRSEERFRRMADSIEDGLTIIEHGQVVYANDRACEIFGFPREEYITMTGLDFAIPAERDRLRRIQQDAQETGTAPTMLEFWIERKNGERRCVRNRYALSRRGKEVIGRYVVTSDITERKRAEVALRESENRFRSLIEQSPYATVIYRTDGRILYGNPAARRLYQVADQGYEQILSSYNPLEDDQLAKSGSLAYLRRAFAGEATALPPIAYEHDQVVDGQNQRQITWTEGYVFPIKDEQGRVQEVVAVHTDISDRVLAERKLQASLQEKDVLLQEVHHRVKNNLQVVSSLLALQADSITDPQVCRMFQDSRSRIQAMGLIHERLYRSKDLSSIAAAEYVHDLVAHLFSIYADPARVVRSHIRVDDLELDIDTAIPAGLLLTELVSNALKHAFPPEWERQGRIDVELLAVDEGGSLLVGDDGVGLPAEFDLRQASSLGLQLVHLLVRQIKGTVELDLGQGTTFRITFPLRDASPDRS